MFNPQIHPSVNRYEITDYEISKEYRDNLPNNKYYSDTDCIQLFSEISMCIKDENDFVQSMKACASISIPVTCALGVRWANISDISPLPHPMSSICLVIGKVGAQAPNNTPSVPTFMAQCVSSI